MENGAWDAVNRQKVLFWVIKLSWSVRPVRRKDRQGYELLSDSTRFSFGRLDCRVDLQFRNWSSHLLGGQGS